MGHHKKPKIAKANALSNRYRLIKSCSFFVSKFAMEAALAALIRIQPQSISLLAEQVGLQKSNLLAAMAGKRPLPERALGALLDCMGLDRNGAISSQQLYRWRIRDLRHLEPLIGTGPLGAISFYEMRPPGRTRALLSEYWLLQAGSSILAIVRARQDVLRELEISGITISDAAIDTPEPAQWWAEGVPKTVVMVMLEQLQDRLARPDKAVTWAQVIAEAERRGIGPEGVMGLLGENLNPKLMC
jgi:hypothetical protein